MSSFKFLSVFYWDNTVEKVLSKAEVWNKYEKGEWPYRGGMSVEGGVQTICSLILRG